MCKTIRYLKTNTVTQEAQALLKILELGQREVESGKVTPFSKVAERLKNKGTPMCLPNS